MKIIILIISSCYTLTAFSQGNLQFNNAFNYELSITNPSTLSSSAGYLINGDTLMNLVVASGKVLKITHSKLYDFQYINENIDNVSSGGYIVIDNTVINSMNTYGDQIASIGQSLWLPEGTYTLKMGSNLIRGRYQLIGNVSGIEFNVIP